MFRFDPSRIAVAVKRLAPVAAFAACVAGAAPAAAAQYFLASSTMNTSRTGQISGPGYSAHVYMAPMRFTAYEGTSATGPSFNFVGFCVDIFHGIGLGTLNLKYDDAYDLTTDSKYKTSTPFQGGTALSGGQRIQVARLVNYGTLVYNNAPNTTDTVNRLSALQGAIWKVINPGYTVTGSNAAVNGYIAAYSGSNYLASLTDYGPVHSGITFISETGKYGTSSAHQAFALAAVPEPGTWTLMIGGFALAGAMLRQARRRPALVRIRA